MITKIKHARHLHWPRALYFPSGDAQNRTLNYLEHFIWWGCFQIRSGNNNTRFFIVWLWSYSFDKQGYDFTLCSGVGWNTSKVYYSSSSLRNTLLRLNWMLVFLKQLWNNTGSTLWAIWKNNFETFKKLFSMTQSGCSFYSHLLKPLRWNIHELWHQALIPTTIILFFIRSSKIRDSRDRWCNLFPVRENEARGEKT